MRIRVGGRWAAPKRAASVMFEQAPTMAIPTKVGEKGVTKIEIEFLGRSTWRQRGLASRILSVALPALLLCVALKRKQTGRCRQIPSLQSHITHHLDYLSGRTVAHLRSAHWTPWSKLSNPGESSVIGTLLVVGNEKR